MLSTKLLGEASLELFHAHPAAQQPREEDAGLKTWMEETGVVWEEFLGGMGKMARQLCLRAAAPCVWVSLVPWSSL